jgi:hypothetical protein
VSVGSFVGGLIALAVVELLLLIYVFAKLLNFRAHKKQKNSASSSAVGIHTCGTSISFNLQVSPLARSLALFLLLDLSRSLCRLVFARIENCHHQSRAALCNCCSWVAAAAIFFRLSCNSRIRVMKKSELLLLVPICKQRRSNGSYRFTIDSCSSAVRRGRRKSGESSEIH